MNFTPAKRSLIGQLIILLSFIHWHTLHEFSNNLELTNWLNYAEITVKYALVSIILYVSGIFFIRNHQITFIALFLLINIYFTFGSVYDFANQLNFSFFRKFSTVLIILLTIAFSIGYWLKRNQFPTKHINLLTITVIILHATECIPIFFKFYFSKKELVINRKSEKEQPDIYVILLDGYPGREQLIHDLNFNNSNFYAELQKRSFFLLENSSSNYNYTPYSIASLLNYEYIDAPTSNKKQIDVNHALKLINENNFFKELKSNGYEILNASPFCIQNNQPKNADYYRTYGKPLLENNNLFGRFYNTILPNIAFRLNLKSFLEPYILSSNKNNISNIRDAIRFSGKNNKKAIYLHLMMPHFPYYTDQNGNMKTYDELRFQKMNDPVAMLEYLTYTNKVVLSVIDSINKTSKRKNIICLVSDHGYRHIDEPSNDRQFSNLLAVNDADFSKMSTQFKTNINILKYILNRFLGYELPYTIEEKKINVAF